MNNKSIAIRYFTKTDNTKKLAEGIAEVSGCKAQTIDIPVEGKVDILFLGASVYWGGIDPQVKAFIRTLDAKKIGKVAVFSTSALAERAYPEMRKLLLAQGITVDEENFYCRGQFKMIHRNKPDSSDLRAAREYAKIICMTNNCHMKESNVTE
jgi:flavodoxin